MRISELAHRTGLSVDRLRRYEAAGLIRAARSGGNYREFDEPAVREATFIAMSRELGLSLADIADWLPRYRAGTLGIDEMIDGLRQRIAAVDTEIEAQRALRRRLVAHIGWFEARRSKQLAAAKAPTGRVPPSAPRRAKKETR